MSCKEIENEKGSSWLTKVGYCPQPLMTNGNFTPHPLPYFLLLFFGLVSQLQSAPVQEIEIAGAKTQASVIRQLLDTREGLEFDEKKQRMCLEPNLRQQLGFECGQERNFQEDE